MHRALALADANPLTVLAESGVADPASTHLNGWALKLLQLGWLGELF